jgi:hypothetical protein
MSPAILREFADVFSILTATSSHESSSSPESDPGNHHTFKAVGVEAGWGRLVILVFCSDDKAKWLRDGDCMNPVAVWEVITIAAVSESTLCNLFKPLFRMFLVLVVLSILIFIFDVCILFC